MSGYKNRTLGLSCLSKIFAKTIIEIENTVNYITDFGNEVSNSNN